MNQQEISKAWIAAGKLLASDPTTVVACPVRCDDNLMVEDIPVKDSKKFERIMQCPTCGSRNVLLMTKKDQ